MRRALLGRAALLVAASPAGAATPVWQGIWAGKVGDLPVRACLARRGDDLSVGSYYYLSRFIPIKLDQQGGSRVWLEGEQTSSGPARPSWTFRTVGADALAGGWSGGGRTLPFRLTRVPDGGAEEPCASAAFNAPRLRPLRETVTRATKDGVAYRKLRFDPGPAFPEVTLATFALEGDGPAVRRVNMALRRSFSGPPAKSGWFECVAGGLSSHGIDGDYSAAIEPTMITGRWLAATADVGVYCGGAHPSMSATSLTFDLATGAEVELEDWLNDAALERRREPGEARPTVTVRPALRRAVLARAEPIERECREAAADAEFWDIGLARGGLRFTPSMPHVLQMCQEATLVPWAALEPYLNAAGRAGAATLR